MSPEAERWIKRARRLLKECPNELRLQAMESSLFAMGPEAQAIIKETDCASESQRLFLDCTDFIALGRIGDSGGW